MSLTYDFESIQMFIPLGKATYHYQVSMEHHPRDQLVIVKFLLAVSKKIGAPAPTGPDNRNMAASWGLILLMLRVRPWNYVVAQLSLDTSQGPQV